MHEVVYCAVINSQFDPTTAHEPGQGRFDETCPIQYNSSTRQSSDAAGVAHFWERDVPPPFLNLYALHSILTYFVHSTRSMTT